MRARPSPVAREHGIRLLISHTFERWQRQLCLSRHSYPRHARQRRCLGFGECYCEIFTWSCTRKCWVQTRLITLRMFTSDLLSHQSQRGDVHKTDHGCPLALFSIQSVKNTVLEYLDQSSLVNMKVKTLVTYFLDLNAHRGIAVQQDFHHSIDIASIIRSTELSGLWSKSQALSTSQEV
ncbi:hypothetical protein LB503_010417 [Fusarium chuoi]|nr:hypothetical protein LB503_010417 [Fusarium chuoi]